MCKSELNPVKNLRFGTQSDALDLFADWLSSSLLLLYHNYSVLGIKSIFMSLTLSLSLLDLVLLIRPTGECHLLIIMKRTHDTYAFELRHSMLIYQLKQRQSTVSIYEMLSAMLLARPHSTQSMNICIRKSGKSAKEKLIIIIK